MNSNKQLSVLRDGIDYDRIFFIWGLHCLRPYMRGYDSRLDIPCATKPSARMLLNNNQES